jgi:hypothetical protein
LSAEMRQAVVGLFDTWVTDDGVGGHDDPLEVNRAGSPPARPG